MSLGYKYFEVDSDVWTKRDFKPNGDLYYKYMLWYVGELIHIGFKANKDMDALNMTYWLKEVFGPPDQYLGTNVEYVQLKYGQVVWSTNYVDYLKDAIEHFDHSL